MATQTLEPASISTRQLAGKYLTFTLHGESYGIDVLKVREIIRLTNITVVPQMPAYVRGVINLRGKIIPGHGSAPAVWFRRSRRHGAHLHHCRPGEVADGKATQMGLVVDGVEEVLNIAAADIEETPDFGGQIATDYIVGMAKVKGAVKMLLDIDRRGQHRGVKRFAAARRLIAGSPSQIRVAPRKAYEKQLGKTHQRRLRHPARVGGRC